MSNNISQAKTILESELSEYKKKFKRLSLRSEKLDKEMEECSNRIVQIQETLNGIEDEYPTA